MKGFLTHLLTTLRLNFRNPQAVVFGYLVPVFFLFAYGSAFGHMPMQRVMGQLLTISILGGACFGMPVAFVSERERGVWRRYRLTPMPTSLFVLSLLVARYVIVFTSGLLLLALAMICYHMPLPLHPLQLAVAFSFASFAFLGLGLVICMIANSPGSVQALGQAIFLPMILIGGVGVPLYFLAHTKWAIHTSAFLPGRYAVQAMDAGVFDPQGLYRHPFNLLALALVGIAGFIAGAKLFRWDTEQKNPPSTKWWLLLAISTWLAVGLLAEHYNLIMPLTGSARIK